MFEKEGLESKIIQWVGGSQRLGAEAILKKFEERKEEKPMVCVDE